MVGGDSLSSIFGWISIACWIIVYTPQIYENYILQSGEGLSILLVLAWVIGDLCNLMGAILGRLVPTVILLAVYYIMADLTILGQVHYYRWRRRRQVHSIEVTIMDGSAHEEEEEPLIGVSQARAPAAKQEPLSTLAVRYTLCLLFVCAFGVGASWFDETKNRSELPEGDLVPDLLGGEHGDTLRAWAVQVLGWTSTVVYVSAAFPQILKNMETRCEGLSPAVFFFATFGNFTYIISICAKSLDKDYLITNASWLLGSTLNGLLDCVIIGQFIYYRYAGK